MATSTATVFALSALGISMISILVYFLIFFFLVGALFWGIAVVLRPIFRIIGAR